MILASLPMIHLIYTLSFILSPPFAGMFIEWKHEMCMCQSGGRGGGARARPFAFPPPLALVLRPFSQVCAENMESPCEQSRYGISVKIFQET